MNTVVRLLILVLGIALTCAALYRLASRFRYAHAVSMEKYKGVAVGMTKEQILEMLGHPRRIRHDTPESTQFFYGGWLHLKSCSMEVHFGSDGRVTEKWHDGF